ncbi:MAG TPA: hypothetical protein PKN61_09270 [Acidobacteriota bacterium]|nr:hypothetical protein [Acidobacteriota bacterium]HNU01072.1 hypothetical protein [Acidobacteriota bacterium]HPB29047.1 hypothetical protein [Acidobacteriota bacterium]HQO26542.1 hypothetical protein [Acidobacteriota bacterium]HQP74783.1 hypothetical protein [Acidobacteriota bacterium]
MLRSVLMILAAGFVIGSAVAAEPPERKHHCRGMIESPDRIILEPEDVPDLELLERSPLERPSGCEGELGAVAPVYEILIDEQGEVECAVMLNLKEISDVPPCLLKSLTQAISRYRFSKPKDGQGRPAACYFYLTIEKL